MIRNNIMARDKLLLFANNKFSFQNVPQFYIIHWPEEIFNLFVIILNKICGFAIAIYL